MDTEASVSVIKIGSITGNINYNKNDIIKLVGIAKTPIFSIGSFNLTIIEQGIEFEHKFHLVADDFLIPSNAIIGKEFLKRFKSLIDFDEMTLTIRKNQTQSVKVPIQSEILNGISALPSRSESFKLFHIKSEKFPCLIESQELEEGVMIPTTIVHESQAWLRVLNTNENIKIIKTDSIKPSQLSDFHVIEPHKDNTCTTNRVQKLQNLLRKKVPEFMRDKLINLCTDFSDIFHVEGDKASVNNFYEQKIPMSDNVPVYTPQYRVPHTQKAEINSQVRVLLENELIELSTSPYNSPVIIVPKKSLDGKPKHRMCIDYRRLNKKIIPDKFPLPRIEEILEGLGRAKFFSVMDLHSGFHQIPLSKESRPVTAFSTESGFYQWKVLPFGINIAPASFSRMMTIAFSGLGPKKAFIYMDDLIVIGMSENNHLNNLKSVFEMCRENNLKLNPEKCDFFKSEVTFLGHNCTSDGLKPNPNKIDSINLYPRPINKEEVTRFHAMANYYRRFIPNFSTISLPLTNLRKKRIQFKWTEECENSFQEIKKRLISSPILAYPDFTKQFIVTVDSSSHGCGGVISQKYDDYDAPIAYISRTFKKGELNKAIIEKELLAIHFALKTFRHYLYGQKFVVFTDHKPLIYLFKLKNPSSKLMRIKMDLEEFDFTIEYIKGRDNVVADALSRISIKDLFSMYEENQVFKIEISTYGCKNVKIKTKPKPNKTRCNNTILAYTRSMAQAKNNPPNINDITNTQTSNLNQNTNNIKIYEGLTQDKKSPRVRVNYCKSNEQGIPTEIKLNAHQNQRKIFEINIQNQNITLNTLLSQLEQQTNALNINHIEWPLHDLIFKMCSINEFKQTANKILKNLQIKLIQTPKVVDNEDMKQTLIKKFHNDLLYGGHCGKKKLYSKMKDLYYWSKMSHDISQYVSNCHICKLSKPNRRTKEALELTETPRKPFDLVQIDTIGPMTKSNNGNQYAITLIDELSKWLVIIPIANKSAKETAKAIFEKFVLTYGPMREIKTDMGTEFRNQLLSELCKLLEINQLMSTAYHHETVGAIERSHRTLNEYLRAYLNGKLDEWDTFSQYFQFLYNTTKHEGLKNKYSPYEIVFLRRNLMPSEIFQGKTQPLYNIDDYVQECKFKLKKIQEETTQLIEKVKCANKKAYDKNANPIKLKIGDLVKIVKEPYEKFKFIYDGPYEVKKIDNKNVEIMLENGSNYKIHKNRIIKY